MKSVDVFCDDRLAGRLRRTERGAIFEYDAGWTDRSIAVHLPVSRRAHEVSGDNLHPFFAGLLPEGRRLEALTRSIKTSKDDLFSLLVAAGADCIGDVSVGRSDAELPEPVELEAASFAELFEQSLRKAHLKWFEPSVPGVQEKISAAMISFPVRTVRRHAAYLLKVQPRGYPRLIENEAFFMQMAHACGLRVAQVRVVRDRHGLSGLLVERFDRVWSKEQKRLRRVHQEDACQFLDRYPADKYRLTLRQIADGLSAITGGVLSEILRLLELVAFSYLIANGDLHAKNISVAGDDPLLTPAYDLLSTLPYGDRKMALQLDGRDDNFTRKLLVDFGERHGVRRAATEPMLDALCDAAAPWLRRLGEIGLDAKKTRDLERVMSKRLSQLR